MAVVPKSWQRLWAVANHRIGVMLLVVVISGVYLYCHRQFIGLPHDCGSIGHAAERVLLGELPHRDFDNLYTGGLAFLHAFAFWLLGVKLIAARWCLFLAALLFVLAVYAIAARVCPPLVAAAVTLLAVVWSVPNYFVALPSWYNLFFAVFGTWALLKHLETEKRRWLLMAGVCAGASLAIKLIGLYFVAAVLLYLLYREQTLSEQTPDRRSGVYSALITMGLIAFVGMLVRLISYYPAPMEILHFVVPGAALSLLLIWNEWRCPRAAGVRRARRMAGLVAPFSLGVLVPLVPLLIPYWATSSLDALYEGVILLPQKRLGMAATPLPGIELSPGMLPMAGLMLLPLLRLSRKVAVPLAVVLGGGLLFWLIRGSENWAYQAAWISLRGALPLVVLAGAVLLWSQIRKQSRLSIHQRQMLFLLLAVAAMVSLVQVPYPLGVYMLYAAPAIILAACFLVACQTGYTKLIAAEFLVFYFLFAVCWIRGGFVCAYAIRYMPLDQDEWIEVDRGRLLADEPTAMLYSILVSEIRKRTAPGDYIYAAPDCPEVYFLAGRRNPTRTFYDFFDDDYGQPDRSQRILRLLEERRINVVVVHGRTEFSRRLSPELHREIASRYPNALNFRVAGLQAEPVMQLRWRQPEARANDLVRPIPRSGQTELHRPGA